MDNKYQQDSYQDFSNRFNRPIENSKQTDYGLIIVGNSRAGKSTISYGMIGSRLQTHHSQNQQTFLVPSEERYKDKVLIQNTSVTETPNFLKFPNLIDGKSYAIIDMPGNDDNKKIRQLINFYYIKKISSLIEKIKFLVVITVHKNDDTKQYELKQRQLKMLQNFTIMFPKSEDNSNLLINRLQIGSNVKEMKSKIIKQINSKIKYQFKFENVFILERPHFKKKGMIQPFSLNLDLKNLIFKKNIQFGNLHLLQGQLSRTHFYQKGSQKDREDFFKNINTYIKTIIIKLEQDLEIFAKLIFILLKAISTSQPQLAKNAINELKKLDQKQKIDINIKQSPPIKNIICQYILLLKDIDKLTDMQYDKQQLLKQYKQKKQKQKKKIQKAQKFKYNTLLQTMHLKVKIYQQIMLSLVDRLRCLLWYMFKNHQINKSMAIYHLKLSRKLKQAQFLFFTFSDFEATMKMQTDLFKKNGKNQGLDNQKQDIIENTKSFNQQILQKINLLNANISLFRYLNVQYLQSNTLLFKKFKSQSLSQKKTKKQFLKKIQTFDYFLCLFKKLQKTQKPQSTSEEEIEALKNEMKIYQLLQSGGYKDNQKSQIKEIMENYDTDKLKPHLRKIIMKKVASLYESLNLNYIQSIKIYTSLTLYQQIMKLIDRIQKKHQQKPIAIQLLFQVFLTAFNNFYENAEFNYANECIEKAKCIFFQDEQKSMIINKHKAKLYDDQEMKNIMENMHQSQGKINWQKVNIEVIKIKKSPGSKK